MLISEVYGGQDLNNHSTVLQHRVIRVGRDDNNNDKDKPLRRASSSKIHHDSEDDEATYRRLSKILTSSSEVGTRRPTFVAEAVAWKSFLKQVESLDDNDNVEREEHSDNGHFHVPFYDYPVQRQRWGDPQLLPHINWRDLFFDLVCVGIAYNLGTL